MGYGGCIESVVDYNNGGAIVESQQLVRYDTGSNQARVEIVPWNSHAYNLSIPVRSVLNSPYINQNDSITCSVVIKSTLVDSSQKSRRINQQELVTESRFEIELFTPPSSDKLSRGARNAIIATVTTVGGLAIIVVIAAVVILVSLFIYKGSRQSKATNTDQIEMMETTQ